MNFTIQNGDHKTMVKGIFLRKNLHNENEYFVYFPLTQNMKKVYTNPKKGYYIIYQNARYYILNSLEFKEKRATAKPYAEGYKKYCMPIF